MARVYDLPRIKAYCLNNRQRIKEAKLKLTNGNNMTNAMIIMRDGVFVRDVDIPATDSYWGNAYHRNSRYGTEYYPKLEITTHSGITDSFEIHKELV